MFAQNTDDLNVSGAQSEGFDNDLAALDENQYEESYDEEEALDQVDVNDPTG